MPTVDQIMTPDPIVVGAHDPLMVAVKLLEEHEISGLPVVDESGALVGVLSETDLVRARATRHLWSRWPDLVVSELMHTPALTADRGMTIDEAAGLMEGAHVHRLIVVGEDQRTPVGVVATSDLVRAILDERER